MLSLIVFLKGRSPRKQKGFTFAKHSLFALCVILCIPHTRTLWSELILAKFCFEWLLRSSSFQNSFFFLIYEFCEDHWGALERWWKRGSHRAARALSDRACQAAHRAAGLGSRPHSCPSPVEGGASPSWAARGSSSRQSQQAQAVGVTAQQHLSIGELGSLLPAAYSKVWLAAAPVWLPFLPGRSSCPLPPQGGKGSRPSHAECQACFLNRGIKHTWKGLSSSPLPLLIGQVDWNVSYITSQLCILWW